METDRELLERYPSKPPKLLLRWNDARMQVHRAGEAFVRECTPATDAALRDAEWTEQELHRALFGI